MRGATIAEVAAEAGVGVGTVSRVLNGSSAVSERTKNRVLAAIATLDYQPSAVARALSTGRTGAIGVIAPFFTSFLVRTLAWKSILADNGFIVTTLKTLHILPEDGRLLATSFAVVCGLTYNFLPFMVLPLYASLEKIDLRLIEAGKDLYANGFTAFRKITLPLSMPGVVAGTLLTFIPAIGDFINAELLGTPQQYMIGNVIQSKFLRVADYPEAAALSFILMGLILIGVFAYSLVLGTRNLTEAAG